MYTQEEIRAMSRKIKRRKRWAERLIAFAFILWGTQELVFYFTGNLTLAEIQVENVVDEIFGWSVIIGLVYFMLAVDKLIDKNCE